MATSGSEVATQLADRGIAWQAIGFAIVGGIVLTVMRIYSESDSWQYELFIVTVTQLYWAFALFVGFVIDRSRKLFETRAQIRAEALRKSRRKGQVEENKRLKSLLKKHRVQLPPEVAKEILSVPAED